MSDQQIYIDTMKEQINSGMYDHLFKGRSDLTFLDIGANIGLVSIYAVPYCKRIVAVEPAPDTFPKLQRNTKDYQIIEAYQVALAPKIGEVDFYLNDINFTASSTVNTYGTKTSVKGWTLSKILDYHRLDQVDVCKSDSEGAEDESLSYQQLLDAKGIIDTYYIETHNTPYSKWEYTLGRLVGDLSKLGYHKMRIDGMALTASKV